MESRSQLGMKELAGVDTAHSFPRREGRCVCDKVWKWTFSPRTGTFQEEKVCSCFVLYLHMYVICVLAYVYHMCTCMCMSYVYLHIYVICVAPLWDCALFQIITVQTGKIERKKFPKTTYTYFLYYNSRVQSQMFYKKQK